MRVVQQDNGLWSIIDNSGTIFNDLPTQELATKFAMKMMARNAEGELSTELKSYGVYHLQVNTSIDNQNTPYTAKQMVHGEDRLVQHIELRAKTLHDLKLRAKRFYEARI